MKAKELFDNAIEAESQNKFAEAVEAWKALLGLPLDALRAARCPDRRSLEMSLAGAHFQCGETTEAITIFEGLRGDDDVDVLKLLARAYLDADRLEDAIEVGTRALELDPNLPTTMQIVGRAHKNIADRSQAEGAHYQRAIDYFNHLLVVFNPHDDVTRMLKQQCVLCRDDSFGETMRRENRRFEQLKAAGDHDKAFEVMQGLVRLVIEHAIDMQKLDPDKTVQITRDFIAMIERRPDLKESLRYVFTQLHCLTMWTHVFKKDPGAAQNALDNAMRSTPDQTLPWACKAAFMHQMGRFDDVAPALEVAATKRKSEHDKYQLAITYQLIEDCRTALTWLNQIDPKEFREESLRPEWALPILDRTRTDIEDGIANPQARDLANGDYNDPIKKMLEPGKGSAK